MLGIMRKYKQSIIIKLVFAVIVLSFIGTIFLVWGRGDRGPGGKLAYAAKVNGTKISLEEYSKSYYRLRSIYEQIYGNSMTEEQEKQLGLRRMALDNLVDRVLVQQAAKDMGIKVGMDEVASEIAKNAAFQKNGAFDFALYQQVLKANRLTPQEYEESQKEDLQVQKARQKIMDKAQVTDDEALRAYQKEHDRVDLQFVSFSPADVRAEVKLTDQELDSYLNAHPEQFRTPEQISLAYLIVEPAKLAANVQVTDSEAQTYYQKNIDRYQGKGGILPFSEVKARATSDARAAKASKEAYEKAAEALNRSAKGGDLNAVAAALGTKVSTTPLFTAAAPAAAIAAETEVVKRAFATKEGELGGPVETPHGIYIFKVTKREAAAVPPLARIKAQVEARAATEKARDLAQKKAQDALAQLAKGGAGLKLQESGPFNWSAKGEIPKIATSPAIMDAAFDLTTAAPVPKAPIAVGDRFYAFRLKSRVAADTADFQKSKEQIKLKLLPKKQQEAIDSWLKELKAKAKIELNASLLSD